MHIEVDNLKNIAIDILKQAKSLGASGAQVSLQKSTGFEVDVRLGEVETVTFNRDQALSIEVFLGQSKGAANSSDLTAENISAAVQIACDIAKVAQADPFAGLPDAKEMVQHYPDLDLYHPWEMDTAMAIEIAKACEDEGRSFDKRISNSDGANISTRQGCGVYANSHGFIGSCLTTKHGLSCSLIAQDGQDMQTDYWYTVARDAHMLQANKAVGEIAAQRAVNKLGAKRIKTGKYQVIYAAEIAGSLIGHFTAAISGGNLYRHASFLCDHLQQKIFPEFVHIHENPHIPGAIGSSPFDSEGLATRNQDFVQDGVLQSYILDTYSARKLNLKATGNTGGVHNLMIDTSDLSLESLLKEMGRGLYVTGVMGQGVNILTGDYSRGVTGFWVEEGIIQYPVHEITVASNLRDMFSHIIAIGNDIDRRSNILTGSILLDEMMIAGE